MGSLTKAFVWQLVFFYGEAVEIIDGLEAASIKCFVFKLSSVDGIRQVLSIVATNPNFPVIMQWTDGHAGGHHCCKHFYQLILATYRSIHCGSG